MPTTNRLEKEANRLDAGYMSNYREELDIERKWMLYYQHHQNCSGKYQDAVAIRRLVEEQKTKSLLDKYKEAVKKESGSLAPSKPKAASVKSEQPQPHSDPSRSQQDTLPDNNKESSSFTGERNKEAVVDIIDSVPRLSSSNRNYSVSNGGPVIKQEQGIASSSSSCLHRTGDTSGKPLSADPSVKHHQLSQQQPNMGICDTNNSSSCSETKSTSMSHSSSRKNSVTNGFIGLPGKPDDELNLNAESFISENATINFLQSVDAESDPLPPKKPTEPSKHLLPQRLSTTSSRNDDIPSHENDVERGMDEFSKVMDLIIKREEGVSHQLRCNSRSNSLSQLPDISQLQPTSVGGNSSASINGSSSSPPPYPGASISSANQVQQAAQQLASAKTKFQHMVATMDHLPNASPMGSAEPSNWQQQQLMQQQQFQAKSTTMQRKPPQPQPQQYDFLKSPSPNVTIVGRDPYRSVAAMNMPQAHVIAHPTMSMNQQQSLMHPGVGSIGQLTQMLQQPGTIAMSQNQPQVYAPLPSVGSYVGSPLDQHATARSNSIPYGAIDGHIYQHQPRRHSMPPQLSAQHAHWPQQTAHHDLMFNNFCSVVADPHQQTMAGQKRTHAYLPPQMAAAKRNSIQHTAILSHTMSASPYHQQGTMINSELGQQGFHPITDPLLQYDTRGDLYSTPM